MQRVFLTWILVQESKQHTVEAVGGTWTAVVTNTVS